MPVAVASVVGLIDKVADGRSAITRDAGQAAHERIDHHAVEIKQAIIIAGDLLFDEKLIRVDRGGGGGPGQMRDF